MVVGGEMLDEGMFQREDQIREVLLGEGGEVGILVRLVLIQCPEEVSKIFQY